MGASISLDSKYRLILNTEVECISINTSSPKAKAKANASGGGSGSSSGSGRKHRKDRESDDDNASASGSDSESGSESDRSDRSGSSSDSDGEKTYTVKLTPEIIGYIRSYIRKTQFLDEFDLITEIELDNYDHAPGSAIVFNSDSIVFMPNNQTLEAVGEWEYLESDKPVVSSKSKSKSKGGSGRSRHRHDDDDDDDDDDDEHRDHASSKYKTKEDDLPVGEIENVLTEKFQEYNKTREFVIHESKSSFLALLIKSVEVVKV
jgi:hypothetical protein